MIVAGSRCALALELDAGFSSNFSVDLAEPGFDLGGVFGSGIPCGLFGGTFGSGTPCGLFGGTLGTGGLLPGGGCLGSCGRLGVLDLLDLDDSSLAPL